MGGRQASWYTGRKAFVLIFLLQCTCHVGGVNVVWLIVDNMRPSISPYGVAEVNHATMHMQPRVTMKIDRSIRLIWPSWLPTERYSHVRSAS